MKCTQRTKIGCGVLIRKNDQILLGKRKNAFGEGSWAMPGGHLQHLEKLVDAAKRELKEELDIDAQDLEIIAITDDIEHERHYIHVTFLLDDFQGDFRLMEEDKCEEWRFFPIDELPFPIFPPHQKILETILVKRVLYAER